ncbi:MAG: heme peroxidase family protein [Gallionella sp.]|nr:heme peroxidase family protein [Gallionella sp.]
MIPKLHYERPKMARYRQVIKCPESTFFVVSAITIVAVMAGGFLGREALAASPPQTLPGRFGRMFQNLPPFAPPSDTVRAALMELGKPGGLLDARDNLGAGPTALITDAQLSLNNPNNPAHTAGTTFMGQFLVHDITFDPASPLGKPARPLTAPNARTPVFDLDSVYGNGPAGSPTLYDPNDRIKFKVESGGLFEDLPRDGNNAALIPEPRNDETMIIAGLHAAFLIFHNKAVDLVRSQSPSLSSDEAFREARRLTTWHYHWMILHEFLPLFAGQTMVSDILTNGRKFYTPFEDQAFIPVEFQVGTRFGHSMARPSYRANLAGDNGQPFFAMIFDPSQEGKADPADLRGGARAPRRFIGWQTFFDFGDGAMRPNKRIDTKISTPLFNLPLKAIPAGNPPTALPQRNLLRHLTWELPSGQAIARQMGAPVLGSKDLAELRNIYPSFDISTPLLYYILKEAELMENGMHLGPVGGRIVGEVFIGLLQTDPKSYVNVQPNWQPTLPTRTGNPEDFRMIDFLTFAGVDPVSRGQ